jgi:hypothetical protein
VAACDPAFCPTVAGPACAAAVAGAVSADAIATTDAECANADRKRKPFMTLSHDRPPVFEPVIAKQATMPLPATPYDSAKL